MKTFNKFVIAGCLSGIVAVSVAFISSQQEKKKTNMHTNTNDKGFAVVELFTSEGCSSCPPADDLVEKIQKESAGKQVYILAYHVDYWDHQGWKDIFGDPFYSERQERYAAWLNTESLYTPQIVVNGKKEFVGSNATALRAAIASGLEELPVQSLTLNATGKNGQISIDYRVNGSIQKLDLLVALVQKRGQSKVGAGENSGHVLSHVQIVRKLLIEQLHAESGKLNISLPMDHNKNEWELIGLVQNRMTGVILAAASAPLKGAAN